VIASNKLRNPPVGGLLFDYFMVIRQLADAIFVKQRVVFKNPFQKFSKSLPFIKK